MPLNKDVLGLSLYQKASEFNDKEFEDLETARKEFWKGMAEEMITHFKNEGIVKVPALGLIAPSGGGPVTGEAAGKIE